MRRQALFGRSRLCDCDGACELVQERACRRGCDLDSNDLGGGTVPIIDEMQRHFDVFTHASCGCYFRYAQVMRRRSSKLGNHDAVLPNVQTHARPESGKDSSNAVVSHDSEMGLQGITSKRLGSRYRSGRSPDWLKFKNPAGAGRYARG
jgi:hypothetical protein